MSAVPTAPQRKHSGVVSQVPELLRDGLPMLKITKKKLKRSVFRFEADGSAICWQSRKVGRIAIDQIKEVRFGPSAIPSFQHSSTYSPEYAPHFITTVYTDAATSWKSLHVIAPSQTIFRIWLDTVTSLLQNVKVVTEGEGVIGILGSRARPPPASNPVQQISPDVHGESHSLKQVMNVCAGMGWSLKANDGMAEALREADAGTKGYLTKPEFDKFLNQCMRRTDVESVYCSLAKDGHLTRERFRAFLKDVQQSRLDENELDALCASLVQGEDPPKEDIGFTTFQKYITSFSGAVATIGHRTLDQDMTRPLSSYYISSSHNTYLLGNQWRGGSSVEGYIRALLAGCRSVEVDCWDGDPEPTVYHGKTLTTPVPLRHVCAAIAKYAFMASPYPLIISAEIHCTAKSQLLLVQILKETFGTALVSEPLDGLDGAEGLPSPEQLKGRILFKCKRPVQDRNEDVTSDQQTFFSSATESAESDLDRNGRSRRLSSSLMERVSSKVSSLAIGTPSQPVSIQPQYASSSATAAARGSVLPQRSDSMESSFPSTPLASRPTSIVARRRPAIIDPLAAVLVYTAGVPFRGFTKLVTYNISDMFSVSERTAQRLIRYNALDFVKHNRTHLTRVYPNGTRLTSSNYQPQRFWGAGCQLVALNMQTTDLGYQINSAFFSGLGKTGYRLKPEVLCDRALQYSLKPKAYRLRFKVVSGQSLALPPDVYLEDARLFVEAAVHLPGIQFDFNELGIDSKVQPEDSSPTEGWKTKPISGNTFNPCWNHDQPILFKVEPGLLDLCFVRVELRHQPTIGDDMGIAVHVASLGMLAQGYRQIPLFDRQMSQFLFSTLLIKINLEEA